MFLPTKLSVLLKIKNDILHQSKNYNNKLEKSNFWGDMWHTVSFIWCSYERGFLSIILLITQYLEWSDDKFRPQILSLGTTANATLISEDVSWWPGLIKPNTLVWLFWQLTSNVYFRSKKYHLCKYNFYCVFCCILRCNSKHDAHLKCLGFYTLTQQVS